MTVRRARVEAARRGRPPSAERDARMADRRQALLDCAMSAVERDGANATMTRMAAEAGVTKPVLYRYFRDRAGLYEAIATVFAEELLARLRAALTTADPGRGQLEAGIDAYLSHIERRPGVYRFLTQRVPADAAGGVQLVTRFIDRVATDIATVLSEAMAGLQSAETQLLGHGITGMVQLAGEAWLRSGSMSRREAVASLTDVLWNGLAPGATVTRP